MAISERSGNAMRSLASDMGNIGLAERRRYLDVERAYTEALRAA